MKILSLLFTSTANGCTLTNRLFLNAGKFFALVVLGLCSMMGVASAQTAFYYSSPTGDGGGRTRTFTAPADSITASGSGADGVFATINEGSGSSSREFWSLRLVPPSGQLITTGVYEGATFPYFDNPSPSILVNSSSGGCSVPRGRFNILAVTFAPDGTLTSLAANFSQQCEGALLPLVGEIRINSSIPLTTATIGVDTSPDPFALVIQSPVDAGVTVTSLTTMAYGINAPTPISIVNGEYKVNDGAYTSAASTVQNTDRVTVRVSASLVAGTAVVPRLTIGNRSATTTVRTYQPGVKLSGTRLTSAPGDIVGEGAQRLYLAPLDLVRVSEGFSNSVLVSTIGRDGTRVFVQVAPPAGETFTLGKYYENVKRFPFNDASAGLNVNSSNGGCSQIFGRFIIRELTRNANAEIDSLAIDFEQRCEVNDRPPLTGEVRVNSSIPFTSLPTEIRYGVTVNKVGRGSGTVAGSNAELSCGLACTVYLPLGWNLSLSATATSGSIFKGWEDGFFSGCQGLTPCAFQITSGRIVTARFELPTKLTVVPTGLGSGTIFSSQVNGTQINCPSSCSADFDLDTMVVLSANANSGSVFTGWSGGGCSGESTCTVKMNTAKTVQANFVPGYILSITTDQVYGEGKVVSTPTGIDCGAICRAVVSSSPGETVTLMAIASPGSLFSGWSGDGCSGTAPCIFVMNQARNIKATFTAIPRRISISKGGFGAGVVTSTNGVIVCGNTCNSSFSPAVGIELVAIPVQGSIFVSWSGGGCSGSGSCVVSQANDVTVTAIFERIKSTLARTTDFNNDGKGDILVQSIGGTTDLWGMNGTSISSSANLLQNQPDWTITHVADFNGDGKADILWRNVNGAVTLWLMDGSSVVGSVGLIGADANWRVTDVADFNGDGRADILWRNTNGAVTLWLMNGTAVSSSAGILGPDANWRVSHVADFNGDGKADLLWRNTNGAVTMWLMNGTAISSSAGILGPDANWSVTHVADFNGDGKADLLWRNTNGAVTSWLMDGTAIASSAGILGPDANWSVTHTADFNGDGKADLLWRNTNGAVTVWLMNGSAVASTGGLIGPDANWRVTHTADFNGDGKSDLLWRKLDGSLTVWTMNGISTTATSGISGATTTRVVP